MSHPIHCPCGHQQHSGYVTKDKQRERRMRRERGEEREEKCMESGRDVRDMGEVEGDEVWRKRHKKK